MLLAVGRQDHDVSVVLVDDRVMHQLNRTYRSQDKPTDVLSFAMHEGEVGVLDPKMLGDIVISVPTARRQASRARRDPFEEVTQLLAHGLLHLVGFDHQTDDQEREMKRATRRLMAVARGDRLFTNRR
jgi:probable rRNA maturation factor